MCTFAFAAPEDTQTDKSTQTIWRLLDYISVDYPVAVHDGQIISDLEYAEMLEFSKTVITLLADLPDGTSQSDFVIRAQGLENAIIQKAAVSEVADIAQSLATDILVVYPIPLAPSAPPDLIKGKDLYANLCSSCHGLSGKGDGSMAPDLDPAPIDFTDSDRARNRSVFGLYQVIDQGLEGTSMASYDMLAAQERWALAFYVGGLSFSTEDIQNGEKVWNKNPNLSMTFSSLEAVTQAKEADIAERLGNANARALIAFLRDNPKTINSPKAGLLQTAKALLAQSASAYQAGDKRRATEFSLSAYLDGFELVEPSLAVRDSSLMHNIEAGMIELRNMIRDDAPAGDVNAQVQAVSALLDVAENVLSKNKTNASASFVGALTIILREGLEALLIVIAMIAYLNKAERPKELRYVHAGWIFALVAGVLTWVAANSLISINGASRELTEGFGALFAAVVLISVGVWMHGKSQAGVWQKYIAGKMSKALSRRSAWFLFLLAFVVVYREVFETILFFIALWSQGNEIAILSGTGVALIILAGCAWAFLNYSKRLPITQFFRFSSVLIAVLAIVLTGKGIAGLQEAGWFNINPVAWLPRLEILGFYPTLEGVGGQLLVLGVLLAAFWINHRRSIASAS